MREKVIKSVSKIQVKSIADLMLTSNAIKVLTKIPEELSNTAQVQIYLYDFKLKQTNKQAKIRHVNK